MPDANDTQDLLTAFRAGDRRALARILSEVESGRGPRLSEAGAPPLSDVRTKASPRIAGITGSGGAGKSTLIAALIRHLRDKGLTVAVLACDPQSPRTGGALLGDRIRVKFDPDDDGVYFRSVSTRGASGGVSQSAGEMVRWLAAFGFDVILVETVGIGQDQVAVRQIVETLVLLVTPGSGDEIQWEKAGVIEVVDVIFVNKSDLPGADRVRQQLVHSISLSPEGARLPVLAGSATAGGGVADLWDVMSGFTGLSPAAAQVKMTNFPPEQPAAVPPRGP